MWVQKHACKWKSLSDLQFNESPWEIQMLKEINGEGLENLY